MRNLPSAGNQLLYTHLLFSLGVFGVPKIREGRGTDFPQNFKSIKATSIKLGG